MKRGRTCPLACSAPADVKSSKCSQAHSTSIHLHDLCTALSESCIPFQTNRIPLSHSHTCPWTAAPTPTFPDPDSADLYQAALVNMPWGRKLANILAHRAWGAAIWHVPVLAWKSSPVIRSIVPRSHLFGWWVNDGQAGTDWQQISWTFKVRMTECGK